MRGDRVRPAAQLQRADLLELDTAADEARRARADHDLARLCLLLEARGEVDSLAGGERRLCLVVGDDLAGLDSDARLEAELPHALEDGEPGARGAFGVVLVRERHAERGHHGVAGKLLDDAAVGDDAVRDLLEELRDAAAHDFRVDDGDELGRADEVDEEHRCKLPFHNGILVAGVLATGPRAGRFP